jgi:uncharacterized protein (DUF58 family)
LKPGVIAALRQRFLGWARPRQPEPLPARIDRHRIYVLPTRFGAFVGVLLATMLLGALNYNNNPALLLGFMLAAVVHNSFVRAHLNLSGLSLQALQAEPVPAGSSMSLHCVLLADPRRARPALLLECEGEPTPFALNADERLSVGVAWHTTRRGWQHPPRLRLWTLYPLGLAVAWCYFRPNTRVLVYPRAEPSPPPLPYGEGDGNAQARSGRGEELHHLRDYRSGDPMRDVAWKSSARIGHLLVREHEQPMAREMHLSWAATQGLPHELRISRLAAWVEMAEQQHRRYRLELPAGALPAGSGGAHRHACLRALAELPDA